MTALRALIPAFSKSTTQLRKVGWWLWDPLVAYVSSQMMEEELPEVDYNFEQWCINKISTSNDELSRQVTVLLDKVWYWQLSKILNVFQKNEWIVKLLQPMLAKNPAYRPQPQHVLKKLGPVVNF